jgi:hypothetical protein
MIGCGNSKLSESIYDVGLKNIVNIDLSEVVINQMNQKNRHRTGMKFLKMDMLSMDFEDASFDVVVDKGTLDAPGRKITPFITRNLLLTFYIRNYMYKRRKKHL